MSDFDLYHILIFIEYKDKEMSNLKHVQKRYNSHFPSQLEAGYSSIYDPFANTPSLRDSTIRPQRMSLCDINTSSVIKCCVWQRNLIKDISIISKNSTRGWRMSLTLSCSGQERQTTELSYKQLLTEEKSLFFYFNVQIFMIILYNLQYSLI